ncbi:MAG: RHS repeat-associated core domain-containing protein [Chloroflexi bacterium]|nr:RHS repeat-associated core domain-containing protein [Chloroflexota bacterium]
MSRFGRLFIVVTWLTILSMVPLPWQQLGHLNLVFPTVAWASPNLMTPLASLLSGATSASPALQNAFPPEKVVLQHPGGLAVGQKPPVRPEFDFSASAQKGPGVTVRVAAPADPVREVDLRLLGVGGRQGHQQGGKTTFDVPASGAVSQVINEPVVGGPVGSFFSALLAAPGTPAATPSATMAPTRQASVTTTSTTTTATSTSTRTSTTATAVTTTATSATSTVTTTATTGTATASLTPTPSGTPAATPTLDTSAPGGNRYGAHLELTYEPTANGQGIKETLLLHDRPRTNVLSYQLNAPDFSAVAQQNGSYWLVAGDGRHVFTIEAPTFQDARGQKGAVSYRFTGQQLDVILDQHLVDTGALPLEVDPTITTSAADLLSTAPPPWQHQSVTATDGTQAFFYYDGGIKFVTSTDNLASVSSATTVVASVGSQDFAAEVDQNTDKIYVVTTGTFSGSHVLRIYPLSYSSGSHTWTVGTAVDVKSHATNSWSGASVAIERGATDYLWVGADEKSGSTYTYKTWHASLSTVESSPTWSETNPSLTSSATAYVHYGALVALHNGVAVAGRGLAGASQRQVANLYVRGTGWGSVAAIRGGSPAFNNGREFSLLAVYDPLSQADNVVAYRPMVAMVGTNNDDNSEDPITLNIVRYGETTWTTVTSTATSAANAAAKGDLVPQLAWDGTSYYLFRLKKNGATDWQINGQRGKLTGGGTPTEELDPDRTWIVETTDKDLNWLSVPRTLGTEIIPFFYIRDKSPDELVVQAQRVDLLGYRKVWDYQEVKVPGAGKLRVNLANGNLHYEMDDANVPARKWNDQIQRVYDAQSGLASLFGTGWSGLFNPRLKFYKADGTALTSSDGTEKRIEYWTQDGSKYLYLLDGSTWRPELGMKMTLEKRTGDSKGNWRITDLYDQTVYFNTSGDPLLKYDVDQSNNATWTWTYTSGVLSSITGVKQTDGSSAGRTQTFTVSSGLVTKIILSNPGANLGTCEASHTTSDCHVYTYGYTSGRLTSVTLVSNSSTFSGGSAVTVQYGYDATTGKLTSITTPEGNVYSIAYDSLGRVASIDLPDVSTGSSSTCGLTHCWRFSYAEGQGQVTVTDPRNNAWVYKALGSGLVYSQADPNGNTTTRAWSAENNKVSETDPLNHTTSFEYDSKANRTRIVDPVNGSAHPTTFTYVSTNRRASKTDARGNTTTYSYTGLGDLDVETDAENKTVDHDYNSLRLLTQVADARGKVTTMTYDSFAQLATETRPDGSETRITHDSWGQPTDIRVGGTSTSSSDHLTHVTYDELGRETEVRVRMGSDPTTNDSADLVTSKAYDRDGNLTSSTDPNGNAATLTNDHRGRVVALDYPIGNGGADNTTRPCTAYQYDQLGNQTNVRVAISRGSSASCSFSAGSVTWSETQSTYDSRNLKTDESLINLTTGEYAGGTITTSWQYDAAGRNTRVTDPRGNYLVLDYDALGRKTSGQTAVTLTGVSGSGCHSISGAVCAEERWEYDRVGNVVTHVIPRGTGNSQTEETQTFTYDKVQRTLTKTNELGKTWTYTYDGNGNPLTETDPLTHATTWTYDDVDRVLTSTDALGNQSSYTYDTWGNRLSFTDPNGNLTSYAYDKASRLTSVTDGAGVTSSFSYDKNGNRTGVTDPRGKTQTLGYDKLNRLTSEQTPNATACTPSCAEAARTATYSYTLDGQRNVVTDFTSTTRTYGYDSARRLNAINYSDSTPDVGYTYDKAGNRLTMSEGGSTTATDTYDELNRLLTETRSGNVLTYTYDRRDNLSTTYPDSKVASSAYDAAGHLQSLDDWRGSSTGRTSYTYDDAGRKTSQTLPTSAYTSWSYDNANRLSQVEHKASSGGSVLARFSYTYDQAGNRLSQTDYDGTNTYTQLFDYDHLHRLVAEVPRVAYNPTAYGYDAAGNRTALGTGGSLVEDNAGSGLTWSGSHGSSSNSNASGGSYTRLGSPGDYVDYSFTGVAATFVYNTDTDAGTVSLYLDPAGGGDGTLLDQINECTSSTTWQNRRTLSGFASGSHTLRVKFAASCPGSVDNHVNVDAFRAYTEAKTYEYDDDNRLKTIKVGGVTDTSFEYDQNGSTTKKTQGANTTTYTYDGARRLTDVSLNGTSQASFAYDGDGARTSKTVGGTATTYVNETRAFSQALLSMKVGSSLSYGVVLPREDESWDWADNGMSYTYDGNLPTYASDPTGEREQLQSKDKKSPVPALAPDRENRSGAAKFSPNGEPAKKADDNLSFGDLRDDAYRPPSVGGGVRPSGAQGATDATKRDGSQRGQDGEARRRDTSRGAADRGDNGRGSAQDTQMGTQAKRSGLFADVFSTKRSQWPSNTQVLQATTSGNTLSFLPGLTQYDPSKVGNAQWSFFHGDAQNNRLLTDGGASISKTWEYDPFGVLRSQTGSGASEFQYASEQKDGETGLINLRARYYDPSLGRFISRDSQGGHIGFTQTFNRYIYALNNPLVLIDPSGYNPQEKRAEARHFREEQAKWAAVALLGGAATISLGVVTPPGIVEGLLTAYAINKAAAYGTLAEQLEYEADQEERDGEQKQQQQQQQGDPVGAGDSSQ